MVINNLGQVFGKFTKSRFPSRIEKSGGRTFYGIVLVTRKVFVLPNETALTASHPGCHPYGNPSLESFGVNIVGDPPNGKTLDLAREY